MEPAESGGSLTSAYATAATALGQWEWPQPWAQSRQLQGVSVKGLILSAFKSNSWNRRVQQSSSLLPYNACYFMHCRGALRCSLPCSCYFNFPSTATKAKEHTSSVNSLLLSALVPFPYQAADFPSPINILFVPHPLKAQSQALIQKATELPSSLNL